MARNPLPQAQFEISNRTARRFLLAHQGLWPPRKLSGKNGILSLLNKIHSIQYDTINVVGRNADLVLQSRVKNYRPNMLEDLLYKDRLLWDGWDKMASIYASTDWPNFARRRKLNGSYYQNRSEIVSKYVPQVLQTVREGGPLSSIDIKNDEKVNWTWGNDTGLARAAMEVLYAFGQIGIDHKVGTRRVFDLVERLLDQQIIDMPDANESEVDYQDWHVYRRLGSLGLAHPGAGEHWLGIVGTKSTEKRETLSRLVEKGKVTPIGITGLVDETFFIRSVDLPELEKVAKGKQPKRQAAYIAPLDNFMWDRRTIKKLFGFEYVWEVYKPKDKREYGYYILPVIYGDQFIARLDAKFDRKNWQLVINNWWWEEGVEPNEAMRVALAKCLERFSMYLSAKSIRLAGEISRRKYLEWMNIQFER
ncbi:MAG: winged helix DNA-binding domain-containing protein [Chloroflexota bacterium]